MNLQNKISFRVPTIEDRELIFNWRNLKEIIALSSSQLPVSWEDHVKWFANLMIEENKLMFLIEENFMPIGQVNFKLSDTNIAPISIYLEPNSTGRGLGAYLIETACIIAKKKWGDDITIVAKYVSKTLEVKSI